MNIKPGKIVVSFAITLFLGTAFACTKSEKPEKVEKTVREQARDVGKFADHTLTTGLEDKLVDIVDKSEEREKRLDEAAQ